MKNLISKIKVFLKKQSQKKDAMSSYEQTWSLNEARYSRNSMPQRLFNVCDGIWYYLDTETKLYIKGV